MSDEDKCMQCGGPLEPCMCRTGCPGGQCADGCYLTTADALRYARKWIAINEAGRGGRTTSLATERDIRMWCRAVIAQAEELVKLREDSERRLTEAEIVLQQQMRVRDDEIAELRAALREAIAYLDSEGFDETAERLRRLADGEH